ncbi:MAG: dihydropteroate synthase [Rhodospirillales bacterium]
MGVVNVTPDSFSDGGDAFERAAAVERGLALAAEGADILDIGGESTRPGARPVPASEQMSRVMPVIEALAGEGHRVSVDTRDAAVMEAALEAGAAIINDVSALTHDPRALDVISASGAHIVLMHMQGDPQTMQDDPSYDNVVQEVFEYLSRRIETLEARGVRRERIAIDPGIGFGKTPQHNLHLLNQIGLFCELGCAVLVGVSRKSFIGQLSRNEPPKERLPGSLAAGVSAVASGAHILRVHDVAETAQALNVWQAIRDAR